MNEPENNPVASVENESALASQEATSEKPLVFRIPLANDIPTAAHSSSSPLVSSASESREDINRRAKMLAPGIEQCFRLLNRTIVKILRGQLRSVGVQKDQATEISEIALVQDDSVKAFKDSLSRLAAPRIRNEETADILVVASVGIELVGGVADVASEIRKLRKAIEKQNKTA